MAGFCNGAQVIQRFCDRAWCRVDRGSTTFSFAKASQGRASRFFLGVGPESEFPILAAFNVSDKSIDDKCFSSSCVPGDLGFKYPSF